MFLSNSQRVDIGNASHEVGAVFGLVRIGNHVVADNLKIDHVQIRLLLNFPQKGRIPTFSLVQPSSGKGPLFRTGPFQYEHLSFVVKNEAVLSYFCEKMFGCFHSLRDLFARTILPDCQKHKINDGFESRKSNTP